MRLFLRDCFSKLTNCKLLANYIGSYYHKMGTNAIKTCKESVAIRSYIFLDLETTGLPHLENRKTKITELTLLGVLREHLDRSSEFFDSKLSLPRVIHKLSICVYPNKQILPSTTDLTGLSNSVLEHQKPFDEALFNMIENFIGRLPGPVCILAHNGFVFDFPILQSEIQKLGKVLPDGLLCADTLTGFKNTLHKVDTETNLMDGDIKPLRRTSVENCPVVHDRTIWDDAISEHDLISVAATVEETLYNDDWSDWNEQEYSSLQRVNETTPKINRTRSIATPVLVTPPTTPPNKGTCQTTGPIRAKTCKKKLSLTSMKDSPKKSFKLPDVYQHLFGHELFNSHQAEADAEALLQCVTNFGKPILDWIDCNTKHFSSVKKMW